MTDAWAETMAMSKRAMEGGIYLRLANDGDKAVVVFCGDPHPREMHWTGEEYAVCTGKGCEHCAAGNRASLRVAFNVYQMSDGAMKIMEGGAKWFTDIVKVRGKYGLENWSFEVERHGAAGDPKTTYSILPDAKLDDAQKRAISAAALHDLGAGRVVSAVPSPVAPSPAVAPAFEPPIDIGPARELHRQLTMLSKADVDAFLARFGITKVTELKAKDEDAARECIAAFGNTLF